MRNRDEINCTEAQFARLPKWARQELERLAANVVHERRRVNEFVGEVDEQSPITIDGYLGAPGMRPLAHIPRDSHVTIQSEDDARSMDHIDVRFVGDCEIEIHGSRPFMLLPSSSNVMRVGLTRR